MIECIIQRIVQFLELFKKITRCHGFRMAAMHDRYLIQRFKMN